MAQINTRHEDDFLQYTGDAVDFLLNAKDAAARAGWDADLLGKISTVVALIHDLQNTTVLRDDLPPAEIPCPRCGETRHPKDRPGGCEDPACP